MSWETILENDSQPSAPLRARVDALFTQQRATWPALADGEAALAQIERKTLSMDGATIVVQLNPARRRSTLAATDAKSVAARPCFLCPQNMPALERGVAFENLVVLPNPFPILPLHCTIAAREHRPQQIAGHMATFLRLVEALGPDLVALYNGPRCGASAPDHFHFQAAVADKIPILAHADVVGPNQPVMPLSSFGRNMLVFSGMDFAALRANIEHAISSMQRVASSSDEAMLNLLGHFRDGRFTVILFPRAAHRPACYFADGPAKLTVSPAVLEMCGLLVVTEPEHFARIDAATARAIYEEVSLAPGDFQRIAARIL
jgi:hypothetical protein